MVGSCAWFLVLFVCGLVDIWRAVSHHHQAVTHVVVSVILMGRTDVKLRYERGVKAHPKQGLVEGTIAGLIHGCKLVSGG